MLIAKVFLLVLVFARAGKLSAANDFSTAVNGFSNRAYKEISLPKAGDSVIISGLSIGTAFAFLSAGAKGSTQSEITTALGFPSQSDVEAAFKPAIVNINSVKGLILNLINRAYVQDFPGLDLDPKFKQTAVDVFRSDVEKINFGDTSQAIKTINSWIADKTNQKIKQTLNTGDISSSTKFVLVNVIYFKASWNIQFEPKLTAPKDFNKNSKTKVQVDMMKRTGSFGFLDKSDWNANVIELDYKENESSMVIILPKDIEGLAEVEKKVVNSNLKNDIFDAIEGKYIQVQLPKFKIETSVDLKTVLPKLGVKSVFTGSSDLSGLLNTNEPLVVGTAIHKAFIDVNEQGTEAAAVTVLAGYGGSPQAPPTVICDRPFLFFIKLKTGEILFSGRFTGSGITGTTTQTETTPKPWHEYCDYLPPKLRPYCLENFPSLLPKPTRGLEKKSRVKWY